MTIAAGKDVSLEYTLRLADRGVVDSNVGGEPLTYRHGARQIVPGLEKELEGLEVGDTKQITVTPAEGYGEVQREAFMEVAKNQIPDGAMQVGAPLQGQTADGRVLTSRVSEIRDETVVLDFNHPLAGQTLEFDVKVLAVEEPGSDG